MADVPAGSPETRRRRPRVPAGIPYSTIEAVAAETHGIGEAGITALRARLHSLRRLDFPNGVSGSSGRHFDYGLADLVGVLAALELAEAYVPPAAAAAIVREGWPEIARCALAGLADEKDGGIASVHPNALFQALAQPGGLTSDTLHVEVSDIATPPGRGRTVDVAIGAMAGAAMRTLDRIDRRAADVARSQLPEFDRRWGAGAPLPRSDGGDGRLRADGPYWSRAASLAKALAMQMVNETDRRRLTWQLGYVARPAPVEAWKTRIEVDPRLDDIGFGAAMATLARDAGLHHPRVRLPTDEADGAWRRITGVLGDRVAVAGRLADIAESGLQLEAKRPTAR